MTKRFLDVVAIIKNERRYILEWMAFHRALGVERFHFYDNDSDDGIQSFLEPLAAAGICTIEPWSRSRDPYCGTQPQIYAYRHALSRLKNQVEWLAIIDLDEFMVPLHADSIVEELRTTFSAADAVLCNWRTFGSAGAEDDDGRLVIERFVRASLDTFSGNINLKSLVRPSSDPIGWIHNHQPCPGSIVVNSANEPVDREGQLISPPVWGYFQLNHYYCKSKAEFAIKRQKGDASSNTNECKAPISFGVHDLNDVEDACALRFLEATKAQMAFLADLMAERVA